MFTPEESPSKLWPWRQISVVLAALIISLIVYGLFARRHSAISVDPVEIVPAKIDTAPTDPVDYESVPSYQEVKAYATVAGKRDLTKSELQRVVELSSSQHPLTALKAYGIILSVDVTGFHGPIVQHAANSLKNPNVNLRSSAMVVIGRYGKRDDGIALLPFLQSPVNSDVVAAMKALRKLGYEVPPSVRVKE